MKKKFFFSMLAFCAALVMVGCKSNQNEPEDAGSSSGSSAGHNYVNLGLSVKWATVNVGAESSEDYGNHYAWGETTTKNDYHWSTYKHCNGSWETLTKYCTNSSFGAVPNKGIVDNKTTLELTDDAAQANWGGCWRMPTKAEWQELLKNCTWESTTQNGIKGYKVTSNKIGYTNKFIFLPSAGYRFSSTLKYVGSEGYYWSSSLCEGESYDAWYLNFGGWSPGLNTTRRCSGCSVRPVLP